MKSWRDNMGWFGFWIFLSILLCCDTYLFSKGYNSIFWEAKTDQEKSIHKQAGEQK